MIWSDRRGGNNEWMHLRCRPFRWPCRGVEAIHAASPDPACPGLHRSHWMPPSGNCSLHIAPAAAMATANKTTMKNIPTLLAVLMAMAVRWYYIARITRWRSFMAFPKVTKHHHWARTCSDNIKGTCLPLFFVVNLSKKGCEVKGWPQLTLGVTYQIDGKHLTSMREYFVGGFIAFNHLNNCFLLHVIDW